MPSNQLFISHTHADKGLADALQRLVFDSFDADIGVRSSSSDDLSQGIPPGDRWLEWIHRELTGCRTILVVLSPKSLHKPWLVWEAGAVQGIMLGSKQKKMSIIPIVFGVDTASVPEPLKPHSVVRGSHDSDVRKLQGVIGASLARVDQAAQDLAREKYLRRIGAYLGTPSVDFASRALPQFGRLLALGDAVGFAPQLLLDQLALVADGVYTVHAATNIYRHDAKAITYLRPGEKYRATHLFQANPGATQEETLSGTAFDWYMKAQYEAAAKGVCVQRVYIVPDPRNLATLRADQLVHLRAVARSAIDCRLLGQDRLSQNRDYSDDFVLIGDTCVGIGVPVRGPMRSSEYHVHLHGQQPGREYLKYDSFFSELYRVADPLPAEPGVAADPRPTELAKARPLPVLPAPGGAPERNDVETAAFVIPTPVNIQGVRAKRLMIVLRTNGCAWDKDKPGCTMCDFKRHAVTGTAVKPEWLFTQFHDALRRFPSNDIDQLDILTLGSFLNDDEVPALFREGVMKEVAGMSRVRKVVIESRTQYVTRLKLDILKGILGPGKTLELGVGVETSDDALRRAINKGMTWKSIVGCVNICKDIGVHFQAYLLIGTPTLSPARVVDDAVRSARKVADLCNRTSVPFRIAFEPVFITRGTPLEADYEAGRYRLVNLWQVVDVIRQTHHLGTVFVGLSDEGLSGDRRPQGCRECTVTLRELIEEFNGSQDIHVFDGFDCGCRSSGR